MVTGGQFLQLSGSDTGAERNVPTHTRTNVRSGAAGALLLMTLARYVSFPTLAAVLGTLILVSTAVVLRFPAARPPMFGFSEVFRGTLADAARQSRRSEVLGGITVFLAPASCVAAMNLFAGLGDDFHATAANVALVTGAGAAAASGVGALIGGHLADRFERRTVYLFGGIVAGVSALTMAAAPRTPLSYMCGVLAYNGVAGVCYTAYWALGLELVGSDAKSTATQLSLFAASTNAAIAYMTWLDGLGYGARGATGLLATDGVISICAGSILVAGFALARRRQRHFAAAVHPAVISAD